MSTHPNKTTRPDMSGAAELEKIRTRLETSGDVLIVGLGDSLTYGWMVEQGFYDRFIDRLRVGFTACTIRSVNAGVPGDTAEGGLARVEALLENSPHLVIVQFGLNDMYQGISAEAFHATIRRLVERIRNRGAMPVLVTSCPLDWEEGSILAGEFYDHIRQVAVETDTCCASLDLYWEHCAGSSRQWAELLQVDHVHPTDRGHVLMAEGLFETLTSDRKRSSDAK